MKSFDNIHRFTAACYVLGVLAFASGCEPDVTTDCGNGESAEVDGATYCLYRNELIIEGFECPQDLQATEVPGGVVCGPQGSPVPPELEMPFECNGEEWCIDEPNNANIITQPNNSSPNTSPNNTTPGNNTTPTNNPLYQEETPTGAVAFTRIAVHGLGACAYDESGVLCWGNNGDGRLSVPEGYEGFTHLTLGHDAGCGMVWSSRVAIDCWGSVGDTFVPPSDIVEEVHVGEGDVACWVKPDGSIGCFGVDQIDLGLSAFTASDPQVEQKLVESRFTTLSARHTRFDTAAPTICGVLNNASVLCASNGVLIEAPGPFTRVEHDGFGRACALATDGAIQCWTLDTAEPFDGPIGSYDALYSSNCALRDDDRVVCWDGPATPGAPAPTPEELFMGRPIAFDIDPLGGPGGTPSWCALAEGGVTCSF